jgi:CRISPR/Cas system CSM-associated protein Csm3 (group 7 of RAMP superfamily)
MTTRLSLFTATLVQDSALSVAGLDQESTSDRPFTMVDGKPVLSGRGLKGAAVAMARRFFDPLPRSVSEDPGRGTAFQRSAWEFSSAVPDWKKGDRPKLRAGVGILQKTGARASGVLYDREVVPAGTRWPVVFRVDWSWAREEAGEVEGILGYVLARHWAKGRCWLGGDIARGLGWCHLENLRAYRLDDQAYETWVTSGRNTFPQALREIPLAEPTHSWCFRALEVQISFGEYLPNGVEESPWGLDMLSVGPHSADVSGQTLGSGIWAHPSWAKDVPPSDVELPTDRAVLMEQNCPLLPGASVRGPLRHTFSRAARAHGKSIADPHDVQGELGENDPAGKIFGTVKRSSRILICDARALGDWAAARLHMHAEDEFSAGSYGSAKRDAVRVLKGTFPVRIVVEGAEGTVVDPLINDIDKLIAFGALCHLPVGGHKTRGAGWGRWKAGKWQSDDVAKARNWSPPAQVDDGKTTPGSFAFASQAKPAEAEAEEPSPQTTSIRVEHGTLSIADLALGRAASEARRMIADGAGELVAWWCEPTIDFSVTTPPEIFGWKWPDNNTLRVDEAAFFYERGSWRVARTASGIRWVLIQEVGSQAAGAESVVVSETPARLHGDTTRFSAKSPGKDRLIVREWRSGMTSVGFTLNKKER